MQNKPTLEELSDISRYERVLILKYNDIALFVVSRLFINNIYTYLTGFLLLCSLFLSVWFWPGLVYSSDSPRLLAGLSAGLFLLPVIFIPVHEMLHLIPLYLSGARDIRFGCDLSQGIVYLTAHRYVITGDLFRVIALTPMIVISALHLVAIVLSPLWWKWILSLSLIIHTTMCAGDISMINFTSSFRKRKLFTYDDVDIKEAYFLVEKV